MKPRRDGSSVIPCYCCPKQYTKEMRVLEYLKSASSSVGWSSSNAALTEDEEAEEEGEVEPYDTNC